MNTPAASAFDAGLKNPAEAYADFVCSFELDKVPEALIERARMNLLDAFGIGLASTRCDFARRLADAMQALESRGDYPVIGLPLKLALRDAAHLNGTLVHGLDFDDTHGEAVVHTSASAAPTALLGAWRARTGGAGMLAAFIIASECASRIGAAARGGFHRKGFHPTGVVGAFGATLGAGYLAGLDRTQLLDAQGIVLSQAGGSMQFLDDGAWTKRNHPGWASACAFTAVAMAEQGYFGPRDPYFGRYGLYQLFADDAEAINRNVLTQDLGTHWEMANIAFKPYPACHMTHAFADAALALKRDHAFDLDDIETITCRIHTDEIPIVCEPEHHKKRPQNAYDAQFSVHYVVAASLVRNRFGLAELEPGVLADARIQALCDRVDYEPDPDSAYPEYFSGALEVTLKDGSRLSHREQMNRGSAANPLAPSAIIDKFRDNAGQRLEPHAVDRLQSLLLKLDTLDSLDELTAVLTAN